MHHGRTFAWLGTCLALLVLIGCVTMGRPLDSLPGRAPGGAVAQAPEIPLVPVPPPPLGAPTATIDPPARITPASAAEPTPPPIVRPAAPTPPPDLAPSPAPAEVTARQLHQAAKARFATIDAYIVRLRRREQIKDKLNPEELIKFKFRKEPWSVHLKWLGKQGQGREVIYVKGQHLGKLHTLLAAGDVFLMPAGKRMAFAPDNPLVLSACRHPITDAGIGASIDRIGLIIAGVEKGDPAMGTLTVLPAVKLPEFDVPVNGLEHRLPPALDPSLPKGGRRYWYFDPETKLPLLIRTTDERGQLVEYYHYDRLQYPVKLDERDFDPDVLWSGPRATVGR